MDRDFIERALRLARGGYADGGDAGIQSNSMPVISDGQVNWGDSSNAADFVRADQAMRAMRSAPAAPEPQAAPMPTQRSAPAPAPYSAPRDVPLPPVRPANLGQPVFQNSSPEGPGAYNSDDGFPARPPGQYADPAMLFDPDMMAKGFTPPLEAPSAPPPASPPPPTPPGASDWRRGSFPQEGGGKYTNRAMPLTPPAQTPPTTDELLALLSNPTKSVASAAIDQAAPVAKFTDRAAPGISMTPQQRDLIIRTIAAESSGKTPEEGQGIAHVIMNRIMSGRYGKTPERVLFAPKQFEPWADPRGSNYPMRHKPGMAKYEKAQAALDAAMGGNDITGGATLFWGPKSQAALGRPAPKWGRTGGFDIGETRFHRDDGGMVEEREAHGLEGFVKPLIKSTKHLPLVKPTAKAPRAFELDYPRGAEANASGRLERSIDSVPLTAPHIAGRQTPGGPDVPLSKQDMEAIMAQITGRPVEYGPLSGGLADAVTVNKGSGRPTGVTIADNLSEAQQNLVVPHAFGHVVDDRAGTIPLTGIRGQAEKAYNTLATGQERERHLTTPRTQGYPREDVPRELSAEMIRAYATDPNYLKTVAPDVAKRIRDYVNIHPDISKIVQFNAVPAAIGAGAMMRGDGEASVEREPHAGGKAVGKAGGELIEKGIKAVSDLFKPAATEMSAEAIAAAEKAAAKAAAQAKQLSRVEQHVDAPSQRINDWQWRPTTDVAKDLDLQEIPPHVQGFGDFMRDMVAKSNKEGLSDRDLIKAYTTTMSSIQRRAADTDMIREASGLPLIGAEKKIRPEGAWSEWLMSPAGQQYLDRAVKGELDQNTVDSAFSVMRKFGLAPRQIEAMDWATKNLPGRSQAASDLVYRAGQQASPVSEWRNFTSDVSGVGPAKSGFMASLLGRGDLPTLDARQVIINTGLPTDAAKNIMGRQFKGQKSFGAQEGVDRLAGRQAALGLEAPSKYDPFYQHLTHHSIWDKASNETTTHADIINAMRNAAIAVGVPAAGAATMPRGEQQGEQQDEQFAHGGVVERALHLARGGYATQGGVDGQPSEEYSDGARPLTIYRGERPDAAAGPVETRGPTSHARYQAGLGQLGRFEDVPPMDPAVMGENWANAVQGFRDRPINPDEPAMKARTPSGREKLYDAIIGSPENGTVQNNRANIAGLLAGSQGTGIGVLDFAPFIGQALNATDMAHSVSEGDYVGAGVSGAMMAAAPFAGKLIKPAVNFGRKAVDLAKSVSDDTLNYLVPRAMGTAGAAGILAPGDAEAAKLPIRPGTFKHPISGTRLITPMEEMRPVYSPATEQITPRKPMNWSATQGSVYQPAVWDRTLGDRSHLIEVNGQKLTNPKRMEGGPLYMNWGDLQAQKPVAASGSAVIDRMIDRSRDAQKLAQGKDVLLANVLMGPEAGDFSHMVADPLLDLARQRGFSKTEAAVMDDLIRKALIQSQPSKKDMNKKIAYASAWPGINHPDLDELMWKLPGPFRSSIAKAMDSSYAKGLGVPDVAAIRYAATQPELLNSKNLSTGFSIAKMNPSGNLIPSGHTTYNSAAPGLGYQGGSQVDIPFDLFWRDFMKTRPPVESSSNMQRAFTMQMPLQKADQHWIDTVSDYERGVLSGKIKPR
jgi:spore germination cell wall hydrolase CwlJ-like protein